MIKHFHLGAAPRRGLGGVPGPSARRAAGHPHRSRSRLEQDVHPVEQSAAREYVLRRIEIHQRDAAAEGRRGPFRLISPRTVKGLQPWPVSRRIVSSSFQPFRAANSR